MSNATEEKQFQITWQLVAQEEFEPVRGNAIASGDDEFDKSVEDEIIDRLESGDISAWFCAEMVCELSVMTEHGWSHVESESTYLGCCSYESIEQFVSDMDYSLDMAYESLDALERNIGTYGLDESPPVKLALEQAAQSLKDESMAIEY